MFQHKVFGARLLQIRLKKGETQNQLGAILGVGKTQISLIENGNVSTSLERLAKICDHYHVSSDYLLGFTDDPTPHNWRVEQDGP